MLILEHEILCSDEDQIVADYLSVGYNNAFCLVVYIESHHAETGDKKYTIAAFVEKEEAYSLAHRLNTSMKELPAIIAEAFDYNIINASRRQINDIFKEIVEYLQDNKCHYKIVQSPRSLD
ncbi:MAG: hypothetical protein J1D86_06740 [Alistipes sp.]|nr:hypothetical protein [Alistipes sp.]